MWLPVLLPIAALLGVPVVSSSTPTPTKPSPRGCQMIVRKTGASELNCVQAGIADLAQLPRFPQITKIDLTSNNLTFIPPKAFVDYPNLHTLLLKQNRLRQIDAKAFENLTGLLVLELNDNELENFLFPSEQQIEELSLSNNRIYKLEASSFRDAKHLLSLDLRANPIKKIDEQAFQHLHRLKKLTLSNTKVLDKFPDIKSCRSLEILQIDRASLTHVPDDLCLNSPKLRSLDLKSNLLITMPNLKNCHELRVLDLAYNSILTLDGRPFENLNMLYDLLIPNNNIKIISNEAFTGLTQLQVLNLQNNQIEFIHPEAFIHTTKLEDLNLGNNVFPSLPVKGLSHLLHLKTFNNPVLREFPAPSEFPRIRTMILSYAYHCCYFANLPASSKSSDSSAEATERSQLLHESVLFPSDDEFDLSLWNSNLTDIWPQLNNLSDKFGSKINELWDNFGSDFTYPGHLPAYLEEYFEDENSQTTKSAQLDPQNVKCLPLPGPFSPCRDLFDWWTLRCGVWIVFLLALLGNGLVVLVLVFSRSKLDVPRFLVCNLAAADFFMGLYLAFLAVVDVATLGSFRKHGIRWQMSRSCQLAGFLGVLSSELSVYTLAVITLERNYAITHAMRLNKRLTLRRATWIMSIGWLFAISMASMPLLGISDYRKFAICLPFETEDPLSLAYVVFLMLVNGLAFFILIGCYLRMYYAIRGSQAWNSNDTRIAKRMALLVFTDFLCWSPIAFFSLTAVFGLRLVSLEEAKIFAVFVLPLNSCCNPFLYAILTKQFKKDCVQIFKSIEESRINKTIGKCRHNSSNFSNKLTPANTNSHLAGGSGSRAFQPQQSTVYHRVSCRCAVPTAALTKDNPLTHVDDSVDAEERRLACWLRGKLNWSCFGNRSSRRQRHVDDNSPANEMTFGASANARIDRKIASSLSFSENYSSSRSDSLKNQQCSSSVQMRILDGQRRSSSWLSSRKASSDSNLSSSRNDSSGSGTTASTSTWHTRSSAASHESACRSKTPRLQRQHAVQEPDSPASPARAALMVRPLATIPSAAEVSELCDEETNVVPPDVVDVGSDRLGDEADASLKNKSLGG
ncbi:lutropin-choriogonadotropic hormone receptor-like, partial [Trichogramma pretiosum]|uniref:lutropin-choriogonadotropic hormone receptor-like n=1 Tax=Trichogramma pretiosum TaxID=7493 RepID=UPI000C7192A7